jgi:hypothetical protein
MKTIDVWVLNLGIEYVQIGIYKWDGDYFPQIGDTIVIKDREYKVADRIIDLTGHNHIKLKCKL